jgi:hypothetical protein
MSDHVVKIQDTFGEFWSFFVDPELKERHRRWLVGSDDYGNVTKLPTKIVKI